MKYLFLIAMTSSLALAGCAQSNSQKPETKNAGPWVGGQCEGCEAIHESPVPFGQLNAVDTLPGFSEGGPRMEISGIVYQLDGKTPAKDVVIYIYHTDLKGNYPTKGGETGWGRRHGYLRGWIKTDEKGTYRFYTLRPASYPNSNNPQHIHVTVKEPDKNEYWIDEYQFTDDPLLTKQMIRSEHKRGGSGIVLPVNENGILKVNRNIILGMNVPDYPSK